MGKTAFLILLLLLRIEKKDITHMASTVHANSACKKRDRKKKNEKTAASYLPLSIAVVQRLWR